MKKLIFTIFIGFILCFTAFSQEPVTPISPCLNAVNNYSEGLLKLPMPSADNSKDANKEIMRDRKNYWNLWKAIIHKTCEIPPKQNFWKELLKLSPIAIAVLLR
jgi:hypothetical protein